MLCLLNVNILFGITVISFSGVITSIYWNDIIAIIESPASPISSSPWPEKEEAAQYKKQNEEQEERKMEGRKKSGRPYE
jgi:hypothetical protein